MSLVNVTLHGKLGKLFGRKWQLSIKTPAEAIRAIGHLRKGFFEFLRDSESLGMGFHIGIDGRFLADPNELLMTTTKNVDIFPVAIGSKQAGVFQMILGAVLIVAAIALAPFTGGASVAGAFAAVGTAGATWGTTAIVYMTLMGASMIIGGLATMFSAPKPTRLDSGGERKRSYLFDGAVQATRQGGPVPVGYGTLHVGPHTVSAGVTTEALYQDNRGPIGEDAKGVYVIFQNQRAYFKASV